ncbi:MAG: ABC transporter substrate-binding protein [Rhizobiaceae bacterium]|nr:ABC transporter substrate-binding protein [Rhizobiaceae bacterium]
MRNRIAYAVATVVALSSPFAAKAEETYKIGSSLGLTGYVAVYDRAWRDGMDLAVEALNAKSGINGKKVELFVEDNKSEPQEAVVGYRKLMSVDGVQIFVSGCVSAGNFAAAPFVAKAQLPMVLCSILPPKPEEQEWAFSTLAPAKFEVGARYQYLKEKTDIRKVAILHDPTPYAMLMKDIGAKMAADYGLEVVATETYKQDDADMSVQIGRAHAAGAGAIVKMGRGGSTVTVAKNIRQLGLDKMLLLSSLDDGSVFVQAGEALGAQSLFVATAIQLSGTMADEAQRAVAEPFLKQWHERYGMDRDTNAGARGWDAIMLVAKAVEDAKSVEGPAVRAALEKIAGFQGVMSKYTFAPGAHVGVTENPFVVGVAQGGMLVAK